MQLRIIPRTDKGREALEKLYLDKDHKKVKLLANITMEEEDIVISFKKVVTRVVRLKDPAKVQLLVNTAAIEMLHGYGAYPKDYETIISNMEVS